MCSSGSSSSCSIRNSILSIFIYIGDIYTHVLLFSCCCGGGTRRCFWNVLLLSTFIEEMALIAGTFLGTYQLFEGPATSELLLQ